MRSLLFCLALLLLAPFAAADVDLDMLRASVVSVDVTLQGEDYYSPWKRPAPQSTGGSGFFIGDRRIMSNAHVVSDAKVIRLKRPDRPEKIDARILFIAHDCDLAILTVDEPTFFDGMSPMSFGDVPELRTKVTAVGYPVGGRKLSITEGVVSRIELHNYVHPGADRHLTVQVDAAINPGNSGGPVVQDDKVVGVAFQTRFSGQSIGYMIPVPVVRHFLKDIEDGEYDGYPSLGIVTASLENPALRSYLGVPEGETGVMALKTLAHSSTSGLIEKNDVIHAVDEFKIENDGTVKVDGDYLELAFVVQEKYVGDTVDLQVRRGGKLMKIPVKLKNWRVLMHPRTEYGLRPEYLVRGGYVFVPLTSNYLRYGGYRSELNHWFTEFYVSISDRMPGQEQLVILSRVLRHDSTRYRNYTNEIVKSVNGKPPRDFHQFVKMLDGTDRAVIEFEGVNVEPLVLDREKIDAMQEAILKAYGIGEDRHLRGGE